MASVARLPAVLIADVSGAVDTFVANRSYIDVDVYCMWLDGNGVEEIAVQSLLTDHLDDSSGSKQIVLSYASDQIRSFHFLEKWLRFPIELADQPVFQLTDVCRTLLLEKYYTLDRSFVREVLGRKFSHKGKKAFEDESHKTGVKINSCFRQYENLRRVFKAVTATPGTTVKNIQSCFLLPDNLARDYACALFMSVHLFELRTRRLLEYSFDDFVYCASEIMKGWTHRAPPVHQKPTEGVTSTSEGLSDLRVDKDLFYAMKEFKFLLERETYENLRKGILRNLPASTAAQPNQDVFRDSTRSMIIVALNVHHSKQFRMLFVDITDKLCATWKTDLWTVDKAASFLDAFIVSAEELNEFKSRDARLAGMWKRFFSVFNACALRLYHHSVRTEELSNKPTVKFETGKD